MATRDQRIDTVLEKYGIARSKETVWAVQGTPVILHKTLEEISALAGIKWDVPVVIRAEANEAVLMCVGRLGDRMEWSIGEARVTLMVPHPEGKLNNWGKPEMVRANDHDWGNYIVSGKQASYPWAMAEKRAKDRVILKLIELSGHAYSEAEADAFQGKADEPQVDPLVEAAQKIRDAIARQPDLARLDAFLAKTGVQSVLADLGALDRLHVDIALRRQELSPGAAAAAEVKEPDVAKVEAVVDPDPYHISNLATLVNSIGSAIFAAKTDDEVEDGVDRVLLERKLDWNLVPAEYQEKVDKAVELKKSHLAKNKPKK